MTTSPRDAAHDDLERYVADVSERDPGLRAAIEDSEELHRLLDTLVAVRRDRQLSQLDVAKRMGVRQPTISLFENESGDPRLSTLQRYARAVESRLRFAVETPADCYWVPPGACAYRHSSTADTQWSDIRKERNAFSGWARSRLGSGPEWAYSRNDEDTVA